MVKHILLASIGAMVALAAGFGIAVLVVTVTAHAAEHRSRPNQVVIISPAGTKAWKCGNVQHPDRHQWVFRDCRRAV